MSLPELLPPTDESPHQAYEYLFGDELQLATGGLELSTRYVSTMSAATLSRTTSQHMRPGARMDEHKVYLRTIPGLVKSSIREHEEYLQYHNLPNVLQTHVRAENQERIYRITEDIFSRWAVARHKNHLPHLLAPGQASNKWLVAEVASNVADILDQRADNLSVRSSGDARIISSLFYLRGPGFAHAWLGREVFDLWGEHNQISTEEVGELSKLFTSSHMKEVVRSGREPILDPFSYLTSVKEYRGTMPTSAEIAAELDRPLSEIELLFSPAMRADVIVYLSPDPLRVLREKVKKERIRKPWARKPKTTAKSVVESNSTNPASHQEEPLEPIALAEVKSKPKPEPKLASKPKPVPKPKPKVRTQSRKPASKPAEIPKEEVKPMPIPRQTKYTELFEGELLLLSPKLLRNVRSMSTLARKTPLSAGQMEGHTDLFNLVNEVVDDVFTELDVSRALLSSLLPEQPGAIDSALDKRLLKAVVKDIFRRWEVVRSERRLNNLVRYSKLRRDLVLETAAATATTLTTINKLAPSLANTAVSAHATSKLISLRGPKFAQNWLSGDLLNQWQKIRGPGKVAGLQNYKAALDPVTCAHLAANVQALVDPLTYFDSMKLFFKLLPTDLDPATKAELVRLEFSVKK